MWAIISTTNKLKFYNFKKKEFSEFADLYYCNNELGYPSHEIENHNFVCSSLLTRGIPIFIHKKEAREHAVNENLTGFKYLQLNPSVLKI